jgi:hypothetical protein
MLMLSVSPWVGNSFLVAALLASVAALMLARDIPSRDVRTLFRRRPTPPTPPAMPLAWLPFTEGLTDEEIRAFLTFARDTRPDFDTLGPDHASALFAMWQRWYR